MRSARFLALLVLAAGAPVARAAEAPHGFFCSNCHKAHNSPGASLTKEAGNFNLCNSCHQYSGSFGFPGWTTSVQAVPGLSGSSHRWDAYASGRGATPPSAGSSDSDELEMAGRLDAGKLMCSTCHDSHAADHQPVSGRGRQTVSAVTKSGALPVPGSGTVGVAGPVGAAAAAKGYLLDVVAAGSEATALYRVSNDDGKSWFGCSAPTSYAYVVWNDTAPNGCQAGPAVALNDGANVSVAFAAGSYVVGDRFRFYVSYPFLRADATNSRMCVVCHRDRNMTTANVQGTGPHAGTGAAIVPGTTLFHHPVGAALASAPRDASGVPQTGAGDGDPSNDLVLGTGGVVSCLTCHRPHNADSNSLTADP